jgi:hypothetical protein
MTLRLVGSDIAHMGEGTFMWIQLTAIRKWTSDPCRRGD